MTPKSFLKVILLTCAFGTSFYSLYLLNSPRNNTTVIYYVPEDYQGKCYHIYYNNKGEPSLIPKKTRDGYELVVKFPPDGKLLTSSSEETFPRLSWYQVEAFIINDEKAVIGNIPLEDISSSLTGNGGLHSFSTFVFDGSETCH